MLDDIIQKAEEVIGQERELQYNLINENVEKLVEIVNLVLGIAGVVIMVFMLLRTLLDILIIQFPVLQGDLEKVKFAVSRDCEEAMKSTDIPPLNKYLKLRAKTYVLTAFMFIITFGGMFDSVQKIMVKIIMSILKVFNVVT